MSEDERVGQRELLQDFIESYRNETCLWKTTSKDYHDRNKKNAAYDRLIEKYKPIDPNATRDTVVKKINNLRTTYKKELNKIKKSCKSGAGTDEIYKPRLWYFELLSFLYDQEVPRPSTSNIDDDENETQSTTGISSTSYDCPDTDRDTPTLAYSDNESDTPTPANRSDSERATSISGRVRPRPKKNTLTEDVLKSVNDHFKRPKQPDNRFEVFGKNVGMKLQELPKEQRIIAEKIINETLFLAEMGSLTISHTVRKYDDFANTTFSTQPHIQNFSSEPHIQNLSTQPQIQNLSTESHTQSHTQVIYTQPHTQNLFTQPHTQIIYTQPHTQSSIEFTSPLEPDHTQSDNTITSYLRNFND
ncbi:uncharacterized protein LOC120627754 [Pararge aegeria]|uniref:uncharacterized protein LOC120627754 n=1 Tax=Pararge aegeria TaxID=116150 RepID=UPI0019D1133D|nr:uncharacterized protein LOC120627754 [Pararge aegeria]